MLICPNATKIYVDKHVEIRTSNYTKYFSMLKLRPFLLKDSKLDMSIEKSKKKSCLA